METYHIKQRQLWTTKTNATCNEKHLTKRLDTPWLKVHEKTTVIMVNLNVKIYISPNGTSSTEGLPKSPCANRTTVQYYIFTNNNAPTNSWVTIKFLECYLTYRKYSAGWGNTGWSWKCPNATSPDLKSVIRAYQQTQRKCKPSKQMKPRKCSPSQKFHWHSSIIL